MKHKITLATVAMALAALVGATPALAGTTSSAATISGNVVASCTLTPPSIPAIQINPFSGSGNSASANMNVTCTNGAPVTIAIDFGQTPNGQTNRQMKDASNNLVSYNVYQDSAFSTLWGSTSGTNTMSITGTGAPQSIPVYIQATPNQLSVAGSYSDTVSITLAY